MRRLAWAVACAAVLVPVLSRGLQPADANGDTRSLRIKNTHNSESIDLVFKRDGRYDQDALKKFNWFLRDWRTNEPTTMDPRLLDLVWEVYRDLGGNEPLHLVSGFRSRQTNNFLRSRSSGVAKESQHTRGKAMDFFVPGVPLARIRERGMLRQRGGVGFYPSSGSPFVHLDVGNVRAWPRMTRDQLVRLFPDGNTIHLPADGKPLPGYETTLARLGRDGKRGETVLAYAGNTENTGQESQGRPASNVLASLFGGGKNEDDEDEVKDSKPIVSTKERAVAARAVPPPTLGVNAREAGGAEKAPEEAARGFTVAPRPVPRPLAVAALPPQPASEASLAAPPPAPLPRPALPQPSGRLIPLPPETARGLPVTDDQARDAVATAATGALETEGEVVAALAPLAAKLRDQAGLAAIARLDRPTVAGNAASGTGLDSQGEQAAALASLAAQLRADVASAELAKLDYRRLDRRTLTPTPMLVEAPLTAPTIGNLTTTMGPALLATRFGRRPEPALAAFGGQAVRTKRPDTI